MRIRQGGVGIQGQFQLAIYPSVCPPVKQREKARCHI
jgi:hypothetical protein